MKFEKHFWTDFLLGKGEKAGKFKAKGGWNSPVGKRLRFQLPLLII
jgi:hypothetical protein